MLRSPLNDLASTLFPANCRVCGDPLVRLSHAPVCNACWNALAPQSGILCACCSEDLRITSFVPAGAAFDEQSGRLCQPCRMAPPPFTRAVAYGGYTGTLRSLIHALKYEGMLPIADQLGNLLAAAIVRLDTEANQVACVLNDALVVAVPLHVSKQKQRSFNHAEVLARAAVKVLRIKKPEWKLTLAAGIIERRRATASQAGLSPHQRRANLRGVFFVPQPKLVAGRNVLLIDDIYTTGATVRACCQALRRAGAASVYVATVARPQRENFSAPQFVEDEVPMNEDVAFWGSTRKLSSHAAAAPQTTIAASRNL